MLHADGARKAFSRLPARVPKRLFTYNKMRSFGDSLRLRESTIWVHALHGDPIKGKSKREVREELGLVSEDEEAKLSEFMGFDLMSLKAVVENPTPHGMPLAYLDGLAHMHISNASRQTTDGVVVLRFEVVGEHSHPILGVQPTGRNVTVAGITWLKFDEQPTPDGGLLFTCTDYWAYWDLPALMEQIGATP